MRRRHHRTLEAIFRRPTQGGIRWTDIESLLLACGATIEERSGSRIRVNLSGAILHVHRPHPQPDTAKPVVDGLRRFLIKVGIEP